VRATLAVLAAGLASAVPFAARADEPPRTIDVWGSVGGGMLARDTGSGLFGAEFGLG
jgi:hypothetical protein